MIRTIGVNSKASVTGCAMVRLSSPTLLLWFLLCSTVTPVSSLQAPTRPPGTYQKNIDTSHGVAGASKGWPGRAIHHRYHSFHCHWGRKNKFMDEWDDIYRPSSAVDNDSQQQQQERSASYFDFSNFYTKTTATFVPYDTVPSRPHDFRSSSGSMYWDTGNGVIRESHHWTGQHGVGQIKDCRWYLDESHEKNETKVGYCPYDGFTRGNREREAAWAKAFAKNKPGVIGRDVQGFSGVKKSTTRRTNKEG